MTEISTPNSGTPDSQSQLPTPNFQLNPNSTLGACVPQHAFERVCAGTVHLIGNYRRHKIVIPATQSVEDEVAA